MQFMWFHMQFVQFHMLFDNSFPNRYEKIIKQQGLLQNKVFFIIILLLNKEFV